jgi:8-oxo-dGTP pyrophosphatase MutT (NUDIX family)
VVIQRRAARALLIAGRSVLLLKGCDPARPDAGFWWFAPGGGVEEGEPVRAAVAREVFEETGLQLAPERFGPVVATRVAEFKFEQRLFRQRECFFAVELARFIPDTSAWDAAEQRSLSELRWWDLADLASTDEPVYPVELVDLVRAVLNGDVNSPIELSGA